MADEHGMTVEGILDLPAAPEAPSGWVTLTADFFSSITPDQDLTNFFNGGEPYWEAVVNPRLEHLQLTESLLVRTRRRIGEKKSGVELLVAPTGEGKSTALRQAVATLARTDARTILWRRQRDAVLDQNVIDVALAHGPGTVLASDNAHLILKQLHELLEGGSISAASGLQLLLASRDTDWTRQARALGFRINPAESWKSMGPIVATKHPFGRVTEADARKIIKNWRTLEPKVPDAIQGLSDQDAAKRLRDESLSASSEDGALLGGLLAVRYNPEQLRSHLVTLLESLSGDSTPGGMTLADVVIVLAIVDVAGVDGIPSEVIAAFCGVDELGFAGQVANRLGKEAVANYSDDIMRSRHPKVSETLFAIAMSDDSDLAVEPAASHLLTVIAKERAKDNLKAGYGEIVGLGRLLFKTEVPKHLAPRSRRLGITLAKKACELRPHTLTNHMSLSECLRLEKRAKKAVETVWIPIAGQLLSKKNWQDWKKNARLALNEFAIAASQAGDEREATILRMAALSDNYETTLTEGGTAFTLHGLALHLSRLYAEDHEPALGETVSEIHGCLLACFPVGHDHLAMTADILRDTGLTTKPFRTPAAFVRRLNQTLARISSSGSDYLDVKAWRAASGFTDLEGFLDRTRNAIDA